MRMLLHTCCAPCLADSLGGWRHHAKEIELYWHNPNIHPYEEYARRLKSARLLAGRLGLTLHEDGDAPDEGYGLVGFLRAVAGREEERCGYCIGERLQSAARRAELLGFEAFSTTLCVSPHSPHALIREAGERAAHECGVRFVYEDLRSLNGCLAALPGSLKLYRQRYCGCVYSELERFGRVAVGAGGRP